MSDDYVIRPIQEDDEDAIRRLWSGRFGGPDDRIRKWVQATVNSRYRTWGHVAVAEDSGEVVGFGMLEIGTREYTRDYLGLDDLDYKLDLADRNGLMHMYCVDEDWEGRGIATEMYRRHLAHFREKGVRRAYGISWHRPHREGADSRVVFEKVGFEPAATYEEFYARASPRENCPDCGGECRCTATVYRIALDDATDREA